MMASDFKDKSYRMTTRDYSPGEPLKEDIEVDVAIKAILGYMHWEDRIYDPRQK